jgi:hypothetical protein
MTMRKLIATLAAAAALVGVLAVGVNPASADVANPIRTSFSTSSSFGEKCQNFQSYGVRYQYGAWGYFVDGCTVGPLTCPSPRGCSATMRTSIGLLRSRGDRVTQNARLRRFDAYGNVFGWSDKSCSGINTCTNEDAAFLAPGQKASVQCNGVYEGLKGVDEAVNVCRLEIILL